MKNKFNHLLNGLLFLLLFSTNNLRVAASNNDSIQAMLQLPQATLRIKGLNALSLRFTDRAQLADAEAAANKALDLAKTERLRTCIADALDVLGNVATARKDYTAAMEFFIQSLDIRDQTSDRVGSAIAKSHIGRVFLLQDDEKSAFKNFQAALQVLEAAKNESALAEVHKNLGDLYLKQKIYGKATEAYEQAMNGWSNAQELTKAAEMAHFLGNITKETGSNDAALTYFQASINLHRAANDEAAMGDDQLSIAQIHAARGDDDLALEQLAAALSTFRNLNAPFGEAKTLTALGQLAMKKGQSGEAIKHFEQVARLLARVKPQIGVPELYQTLAKVYQTMGNAKQALTYFQAYNVAKDSVFNFEKNNALLDLTTKYESEFALKEKTRQLAGAELSRQHQRNYLWLLVGLLLASVAAGVSVFRSYKVKQQDNEKLLTLNTQIKEQHNILLEQSEEIKVQNELIRLRNEDIVRQKEEIDERNTELNIKNVDLDILNQQLVEEMAEREQSQNIAFSKDHFLANMTYKLRSPLNEILGFTHWLQQQHPREDQREQIQHLQFSANKVVVLLNDILDYSHIEAGKLQLENKDFTLADVMTDVQKEARTNEIVTITYHADEQLPNTLNGDSVRLTQILTYVLRHLSTKMNVGNLHTTLQSDSQNSEQLFLSIKIQATGARNADTLLSQICEIQHDENDKISTELHIAQRLIALQNGQLSFLKNEKVATLQILLPYRILAQADEAANESRVVNMPERVKLSSKHILLVEDNKINQLLVANVLRKHGATVVCAENGLLALDALAGQSFDLVLMDIQMPLMDGYRATAEIRKMNDPVKKAVPIVAMTASLYLNETEKAQLFGMTDYIGKPFAPEELLDKVIDVLNQPSPPVKSAA
jgi:CheY-like chemotaxis protein